MTLRHQTNSWSCSTSTAGYIHSSATERRWPNPAAELSQLVARHHSSTINSYRASIVLLISSCSRQVKACPNPTTTTLRRFARDESRTPAMLNVVKLELRSHWAKSRQFSLDSQRSSFRFSKLTVPMEVIRSPVLPKNCPFLTTPRQTFACGVFWQEYIDRVKFVNY